MPFTPFPPNTPLPPPLVQVLFKGLIILRPDTGGVCTVKMHRGTDDHFLIIEVRGKPPRERDFLVTRRAGLLQNTLSIGVDPAPGGNRVFAFHPEGGNLLNRKNGVDGRDLRWAIDLLHPGEFHGANDLVLHEENAPGIRMTDGVFFTADITDDREIGVRRKRSTDNLDLHRIATIIGAIIPPPASTSRVVLDWGGGEQPLSLPRTQDPAGTVYTISVRNDPVVIDFEPTHDELEEYYDLVRKRNGGSEVPQNEQFRLEFSRPSGLRTTDRIPCMPVILGE